MLPRKSHQKSRRGCRQCKTAHIKCTEDGPPCGRCKLRSTPCEYVSPAPSSDGNSIKRDTISPTKSGVAAAATNSDVRPSLKDGEEELLFPHNTRLLELQLMHRWSTVTYKSMVTPAAQDDYVYQVKVPRWALQYDFLLHGLLALTAFSVASTASSGANRDNYVNYASECQGRALGRFRRYLEHTQGVNSDRDAEGYEPVLGFSLMLMVLALASAQFTHGSAVESEQDASAASMVSNTITHYELVRGCGTIMGAQGDEYLASNPYVQKLTRFEDLPRLPVDSPSAVVLAKLNESNERRLTSTIAEAYEARVQHVKYFEACKKAIGVLQECCAKCAGEDGEGIGDGYQGYILGWLNMAGDEYVVAIKQGDQVALLVLMFWGALFEKFGMKIWWARRFGRLLVEEIASEVGRGSEDAFVREIIAAAVEMVVTSGD